MDGLIDPVQFVAFMLAAALSALVLTHQFFTRFHKHAFSSITFGSVFIGALIAIGAFFSAVHNKSGESIAWLYSSEAIDTGVFEWLTVLCLVLTCIFSVKLARNTGGLQRLGFAGLAIASFFVAGEEMSWGQWIFRWETPEAMSQVNLQDETNLHNLVNPRIYDMVYYFIGYAVLILSLFAYFFYKDKPDGTRQTGFRQLMTSAGTWLRDSRVGLVVMVGAATLFQHELFEEYAEFVLILGVTMFVWHHAKLAKAASA